MMTKWEVCHPEVSIIAQVNRNIDLLLILTICFLGMPCGMVGEFKSPLIDPPNLPMGNPKKKRRTSAAAVTPQPSPVLQDLMPQQPNSKCLIY